ncbi:MAG: sodium:proton antiporter, partial [Acidobacteriota bacterium]
MKAKRIFPVAVMLILFGSLSFGSEVDALQKEQELGLSLPLWTVLPFIIMLLTLAITPLTHGHIWEKNRNKAIITAIISIPMGIYIAFLDYHELIHVGLEYFSFIVLLGSLFTISGGIYLRGDLRGTPLVNTIFLAVGSIFANFIGTTGASMVLIRPLLKTNSERRYTYHIPVFFIFIVSNIGGLLTPLGDPPLFLGYLRGVPFFWTLRLIPEWLFAVSIVLLVFYIFDRMAWKKEKTEDLLLDLASRELLSIDGKRNFILLAGVIAAVFLKTPIREAIMILMAVLAYNLTPKEYHESNKFTFHPIVEVAVLFAGIFTTMVPALLILKARGAEFGITQPWQFFWLTGSLSSFLDNAPTYLTFLSLAQGLGLHGSVVGVPEILLKAVSTGAVFMGANSYIGNGPNFMVKAICEERG